MVKIDLALANLFLKRCNTGGVKYRFCHWFCHYMIVVTACFVSLMLQIKILVRPKEPGGRWCKKCVC
jgi:hypothetical protein